MAMNFPNSPNNGDTHVVNGKTFIYDTSKGIWNVSGAIQLISVSDNVPANPINGDMWFNSADTNTYMYYSDGDSNQWIQLNGTSTVVQNITNNNTVFDTPTITSVSPANYNGADATTFTIQGTNFNVGTVVKFIDSSGNEYTASSTSVVTQGELTAVTPQAFTESQGPLDVKVTTGAGAQTVTATDMIQTGGSPVWTTAAGQLGSNLNKDSENVSLQIAATDPDGDFVSYGVASGALAPGLSLAAGTGLITGNITTASISADTSFSFTANANDTSGNITQRVFSINVLNSLTQNYYTWKMNWGGGQDTYWGHDYGRSPSGSYISGVAKGPHGPTGAFSGTDNPHDEWTNGNNIDVTALFNSNWGAIGTGHSITVGVYVHSGGYSGRAAGTNLTRTITWSTRDFSGGNHRLQSGTNAKMDDEHFNSLQGDVIYVTVQLP